MTDTSTEAVMLSAATCLLLEGKFAKEADYRALSAENAALRAQVATLTKLLDAPDQSCLKTSRYHYDWHRIDEALDTPITGEGG